MLRSGWETGAEGSSVVAQAGRKRTESQSSRPSLPPEDYLEVR